MASKKKKRIKRNRRQITCRCSVYHFPHRLSGGKCTIEKFAERRFNEAYGSNRCSSCSCHVHGSCEVAEGIESAKYCEYVIELENFHEIKLTK